MQNMLFHPDDPEIGGEWRTNSQGVVIHVWSDEEREMAAKQSDRLEREHRQHWKRHPQSKLRKDKIVLIGCGNQKASEPTQGKNLYVSSYFRMHREYAQNSGCPWGILSAKYWFVDPEEVYAPYNVKLSRGAGASVKSGWAVHARSRCRTFMENLKMDDDATIEILAPQPYADSFAGEDPNATQPMKGLGQGYKQGWLKKKRSAPKAATVKQRRPRQKK